MGRHLCEITPEVSRLRTEIEIEKMDLGQLRQFKIISPREKNPFNGGSSPERSKLTNKGKMNLTVQIPVEVLEEGISSDESKEKYDIIHDNGRFRKVKASTYRSGNGSSPSLT